MSTTLDRVRSIIADVLGVHDRSRVIDAATLRDDLGADDLTILDLSVALEETFEIELSDDDVLSLVTVGDVSRIVVRATEAVS